MSEGKVVNVSPHVLADVITCNTKAWVRHVQGYTSKGDALKALAGQAIHAGMAEYLGPKRSQSRSGVTEAFHAVYDEKFRELEDVTQLESALTPKNLMATLDRWCEMHPHSVLPWQRVIEVETAFVSRSWVIQGQTVQLIVRPDAVVEDYEGKYRFVDTKSTGWRISDGGWRQKLRMSFQVQLYADAIVQRFGEKAIFAGWVNAVEVKKLPNSTRKCPEHGRPYIECGREHASAGFVECYTTKERTHQAVQDAIQASHRLIDLRRPAVAGNMLPQQGTANEACRWCPAAEWCEGGRIAPLENFMKYEPWVVEIGERG